MNPSQNYPSNAGGSAGSGSVTPSALVAGLAGTSVSLAALSVSGNMSVAGTTTTTNTAVSISEQTVITNAGTGPALSVTQNGTQPVASFVDGEGTTALKIWDNGLISVGSGTQPVQRLEVTGNIAVLGTGAQFIGNLTGNATTATTATTSLNCTGNAASATTAAACTGNAATVSTITSSQVTTALTYTPYSNTNPSGYISAVPATVSTLTNFTGGLTTGGLTVLNTGSSLAYSKITGWPISTNNFWSANSANVWLTTGNVGIGSTAPTVALDVVGAANLTGAVTTHTAANIGTAAALTTASAYTTAGLNIVTDATISTAIKVINGTTTQFYVPGNNSGFGAFINCGAGAGASTYALRVVSGTGTTSLFEVTGAGNVGIGSQVPAQALDVNGYIKNGHCAFLARGTTGTATTIMQYNSVDYQYGSAYSITTFQFTAPVKGVYCFSANAYVYSTSAGVNWLAFQRNSGGTLTNYALIQQPVTGTYLSSTSATIFLNSGDTLYVESSTSSSFADTNGTFSGALLFATG